MSLAMLKLCMGSSDAPHALFFISLHQPMKVELNIC